MSYQVLARKWRPHDFDSMVGQDAVVAALRHALDENRLHHAYLFTGTRGVGKTTLSRILAKCLNCTGEDGKGGVTSHPCGKCDACRAIDEGRFPDYIEIDAASNRSVEEITPILERAVYAPTQGRYKVYMIDEVHMLSTHAFNAMLKTLEEPPEHVKFILATTDPQKVPMTVLSRCLQFNLRNMTPAAVADHMQVILEKEGIEAEKPALLLLGKCANGSMRDGLSLLDQAIAYAAGPVTLASVREMLGVAGDDALTNLLTCVAAGDAAAAMQEAERLGTQGLSYSEAIRAMAALLHRIAVWQKVPDYLADSEDITEGVKALARAMTPEEVQLDYQIALQARNDMPLAPDEFAGFTMAVLRMLAFRPAGTRVGLKVPEKGPSAKPAAKAAAPVKASPAAAHPQAAPAVVEPAEDLPAVAEPDLSAMPPWEDEGGEPGAG